MRRFRSAFALEVFDRRNARSERLPAFLSLYVRNFGPEHRTNTNELMEFLIAPPVDRSITYFGLTYNGAPCGFATFMHYPEGPIGIVDHLVLSHNNRGYGAFFSFCELIATFLEERGVISDHVAAEIMLGDRQTASTISPLLLVRLMRIVGFRVAKVRYWAPDPAIISDAEGCKAALLLASQPERSDLPVEEFLHLVKGIYQSHYAGWYKITMSSQEFSSYLRAADEALKRIIQSVGMEKRVALNGMKNLDLQFVIEHNPPVDVSALTYIGLLVVPAAVGVAVALTQELWVTASAAALAVGLIAVLAARPGPRQALLRFFRLLE
jgi:hypothetical protein